MYVLNNIGYTCINEKEETAGPRALLWMYYICNHVLLVDFKRMALYHNQTRRYLYMITFNCSQSQHLPLCHVEVVELQHAYR